MKSEVIQFTRIVMPRQERLVRLVGKEQRGWDSIKDGWPVLAGMLTEWTCGFKNKTKQNKTDAFASTLDVLLLGKSLRKREMYPCNGNKGNSICDLSGEKKKNL